MENYITSVLLYKERTVCFHTGKECGDLFIDHILIAIGNHEFEELAVVRCFDGVNYFEKSEITTSFIRLLRFQV